MKYRTMGKLGIESSLFGLGCMRFNGPPKGDSIIVDGKLVQDVWEGKDGSKHEKVRIEAARICFNNPSKPKAGPEDNEQGETTPETPPADIGRPSEDEVAVPF